jgi:hypothetical protein
MVVVRGVLDMLVLYVLVPDVHNTMGVMDKMEQIMGEQYKLKISKGKQKFWFAVEMRTPTHK